MIFAKASEKALTVSSDKQEAHQDNPGTPDPEGSGLDACRAATSRVSKRLVSPHFRIKKEPQGGFFATRLHLTRGSLG
jgi:hypothetical protein